jgi:signal transduction histidine kinase
MLPNPLNSLKLQIPAALLLLLLLFASSTYYTFQVLERHRDNESILSLAEQLLLTLHQLNSQAMRYQQNAPGDFAGYNRDLGLYYQDLQSHVEQFDHICRAFSAQELMPKITGLTRPLHIVPDDDAGKAIASLEATWQGYRRELFEALGANVDKPRLQWAAAYIIAHHHELEQATNDTIQMLQQQSTAELQRLRRINLALVAASILVGLGVTAWIFLKVLLPLNRATQGFRRVTQGDFGLQVAVAGSSETAQLAHSFNHLSSRLKVLFDLIERLQEGSDLNQTLAFLSREFQGLLRIDWIGILFLTGDGQALKLEAAYLDGEREIVGKPLYRLQKTLLKQAMDQGRPLHVAEMRRTAAENRRFVFLRNLIAKGMHDTIFLPLTERSQSPVPGVLVFAARTRNSYDQAQLQFLNNIAQLVTHSFGRTLKLTEHTRLAAIGEFASGIAHEVRSPLATVGMALDHFKQLELPGSSSKRADLASREVARMGRLLEEMLLYAKPLKMRMEPLAIRELLGEFVELQQELAATRKQRIALREENADIRIIGDRDRLAQVLSNLTRNACEAAPEGSTVTLSLHDRPERGVAEIRIHNEGQPIPAEVLPRLTEPFFTTKQEGTGLGLAIVSRMLEAHGGGLAIRSEAGLGTLVTVALPRVAD